MFISLFISHFVAHSHSFLSSFPSGPFPVSLQLGPERPAEEPAAGKSMNKERNAQIICSKPIFEQTTDTLAVLCGALVLL